MAKEQGRVIPATWITTKDPRIKMRGDVYWARFVLKGVRVEESLKTKSFALARQLVEQMHARILLEGHHRKAKFDLFKDAWPQFLRDKELGVYTKKGRPRTLQAYKETGNLYFIERLGHYRLSKFTTEDFTDYVEGVRKDKGDIRFFNHTKYLNGFFSWAYARGIINRKPKLYDPDKLRPGYEDEEEKGRALEDWEVSALLTSLSDFELNFRTYVLMGIYMGMRSSEITQLKKDRVDLADMMIRLRAQDTKTKQPRSVGIHREAIDLLSNQMAASESDFLFPNHTDVDRPMDRSGFKRQWDKLRDVSKVDCLFHDLRRTCATRLFGDTKTNPIAVCAHLGMSLRTAQKHYIRLNEKTVLHVMENYRLDTKLVGHQLDKGLEEEG